MAKQGPFYAHSLAGRPALHWEPLADHLNLVAELAAQFADKFSAGDWGHVLGLWHDLGKYSLEFQAYLHSENGLEAHLENFAGRVDHSTAGAQYAFKKYPEIGSLLAYCIAGHHSGLCDRAAEHGQSDLDNRLKKPVKDWRAAPADILTRRELPMPRLSLELRDQARAAFQLSLFGRMLFSSLVDADYLTTERFMSTERASLRPTKSNSIRELHKALDSYLSGLASTRDASAVNQVRQRVLQSCRDAATSPPGLFSLTVPTGGGKTFSALMFALAHAAHHGLDRVICAIPFTSIIEQTADEYRKVFADFGTEVVLEHHSNLDPARETATSRLAAENWDASLIVTTNVQLFESLFAAQTSRCRKLHRIAGSVIILDEAQTLPVEYLKPCLSVISELAINYRCTIVLCTATQPALDHHIDFPIGLERVREIIAEPEQLYRDMKRVDAHFIGRRSDPEITEALAEHQQFLCIVNTRPHAVRLYQQLQVEDVDLNGTFHLSTFMCGAHRSSVLAEIRARLDRGERCRVISTQLIEAGVDVDFPVVYRALAGLDSIAQAAGRCNREGKQLRGHIYIFEPTDVKLRGYLASTAQSAAEVIPDADDLLDPAVIRGYFKLHYWKQQGENRWDKKDVMGCFKSPVTKLHFQYRTASDSFQFIEDVGQPVVVPYEEQGERLIERLRHEPPSRDLLRRLQRYTVTLHDRIYNAMLGADIELLETGYAVLVNSECYDPHLGFRADRQLDRRFVDPVILRLLAGKSNDGQGRHIAHFAAGTYKISRPNLGLVVQQRDDSGKILLHGTVATERLGRCGSQHISKSRLSVEHASSKGGGPIATLVEQHLAECPR